MMSAEEKTPLGKLPDLANGYLNVGTESHNVWQTNILSVLEKEDGAGKAVCSYLSKECSAESVSAEKIFDEDSRYLFQAAKTWDGVYCFRSGQSVLTQPERIFNKSDLKVDEVCFLRPAREVGVSEMIGELQSGARVAGEVFARISYRNKERMYNLYTPCTYINFPHKKLAEGARYVQPISGPVLLEWEDVFRIGYVVSNVSEKGIRTEFALRKQVACPVVFGRGWMARKISACAKMFGKVFGGFVPGKVFVMDEYSELIRFENSKVVFYRYLN